MLLSITDQSINHYTLTAATCESDVKKKSLVHSRVYSLASGPASWLGRGHFILVTTCTDKSFIVLALFTALLAIRKAL